MFRTDVSPGPLGFAQGQAISEFTETLTLTSATVPICTPVDVAFKVSVAARKEVRIRGVPINFTSSVSLNGSVNFSANYGTASATASGSFALSPDGSKITSSGLLSNAPTQQTQTLTLYGVPVGQQISFIGNMNFSGGMYVMLADVSAQASGVWGA